MHRASPAPYVQRLAGYLAGASAVGYMAVKIAWISWSATGTATPDGWSSAGWVTLNAVTVAMAALGGMVGVGIARDWRRPLPAPMLVLLVWLICGFLISLLPYMVASTVLEGTGVMSADAPGSSGGSGSSHLDAQAALIGVAFGGIALGVLAGLPSYLVRRWPSLLSPARTFPPRSTPRRTRALVGIAAVIVGSWWLAWGLGLTIGGGVDELTGQARLLEATLGGWALATGTLILGARLPGPPALTTVTVFVGSGSMFAWSSWRLAAALWAPPGYEPSGSLAVLVPQYAAMTVAGAIGLHLLLGSVVRRRGPGDAMHGPRHGQLHR